MKHNPKCGKLLLLELIFNLFLFAVCAAVCVGLLLHARGISQKSTRLTQAVYLAQTIAEQWKADASFPPAKQVSGHGLTSRCTQTDTRLDIYIYQGEHLVYTLEGVTRLG